MLVYDYLLRKEVLSPKLPVLVLGIMPPTVDVGYRLKVLLCYPTPHRPTGKPQLIRTACGGLAAQQLRPQRVMLGSSCSTPTVEGVARGY